MVGHCGVFFCTLSWKAAHISRFGSHFDGLTDGDDPDGDILKFAKRKLLNNKDSLEEADVSGSLACLAMRFGLEFNEDEDSRDVSYKQVERHMRICLAASTGFKKLITCSASEPLLAEAAYQLMLNSSASPVKILANHANLYCVDRGRRGELVASLIIMQARDASLPGYLAKRRWVPVTDFMEALLQPELSKSVLNSLPTLWREGDRDISFCEKFRDCYLWFNHVIKVEDSDVIKPKFIWKYIMRGAMIVCKDNQEGVDIILPVSTGLDKTISRRTVTAITIQVKNSESYGPNVDSRLFHAMDPCRLGMLSDDPLPIIRIVFALASPKAGVGFPPRRERENHRPDKFTSFDIWCAGLSTKIFKQIGGDLDSYVKLLDRSQTHDAFNVSEPNYPLSGDTKAIVGEIRWRMAPLVRSLGHDEIHHKSA